MCKQCIQGSLVPRPRRAFHRLQFDFLFARKESLGTRLYTRSFLFFQASESEVDASLTNT